MVMLDSTAFDGATTPPQLTRFVLNALIGGSPFANALTRLPSERGSVTFPIVSPAGFDWVGEGQPLPAITPGDDTYTVAVAKLAGVIDLTNELLDDNELPIAPLLAQAVQDSMSFKLDDGLLHGSGVAPFPQGILAGAEAVSGANLRAAVIAAWGSMSADGGTSGNIRAFANPETIAAELGRVDGSGRPIHPDSAELTLGPVPVTPVPALGLTEVLVVDTSRTYLVPRQDFAFDLSPDAAFYSDAVACRIKGRFAVAAPVPTKSLRKVTITP